MFPVPYFTCVKHHLLQLALMFLYRIETYKENNPNYGMVKAIALASKECTVNPNTLCLMLQT